MYTRFFFFFIFLFGYSTAHASKTERDDSLYKILSIKTKGDYYLIHAKRNDSLFKIISKKEAKPEIVDLELLKKGKFYDLYFGKEPGDTAQYGEALAGNASPLHVKRSKFFIVNGTRFKFAKRFHYRIYIAKNIRGLYYFNPELLRWNVSK